MAFKVTWAMAQSQEVQQLLLNVEKLAQFKQILSDMKKGYQVISTGYNTIKDLSQGNFSLHKTFLDGLLEVSPAVKKYKRIADIINCQLSLMKEYKSAYRRFEATGVFDGSELNYISGVYERLLDQSLKNLDALTMVITAGQARMNDNERITAIDGIYEDMQDMLVFLRHFNGSTNVLALQRRKASGDIGTVKSFHGIKN